MQLEALVGGVAVAALLAYGVLAGADFGGGIWDLFAFGPRRQAQRKAVASAIAPVWEANHVWLIFVIVLLFSGFPPAFSALSIALFTPFHLALVGIILRGAAFVFRAYGPQDPATQLRFGWIFGSASTITPVLLGMCLASVCSGNVRVLAPENILYQVSYPWLTPLAWAMGLLALALCAYLAAVFLSVETTGELQEDFRLRALWSGTVVVVLSVVLLPLLATQAPVLWKGLQTPRAAIVLGAGTISALISGASIQSRRYALARVTAIIQVTMLLFGWTLAMYPYVIIPDLTIYNSAASENTLRFILYSLPLGGALLIPSLWLLFRVFKQKPNTQADRAT